jgi:23S rRNA (uracil1939-C5)-methyltransferase
VSAEAATLQETAPRCAHYGACGGCQSQHLLYETQLALKRARLEEMFAAAGIGPLPVIEVEAAEPWHYRNRIRLRVEREDGEWRMGYSRRGSNEFLAIAMCPIAAEPLWETAAALVELARTDRAAAALLEASAEVELFANDDLSQVQLTFFARGKAAKTPAGFESLFAVLQAKLAIRLAGAGLVYADPQSGRILRTLAAWDAAGLAYRVGEETYWVTRGGFFQVNRFLLEALVRRVTREGDEPRRGELAWDLFAGVGLFARVLARRFGRVTAVEANATAVADLRGWLAKMSPASEAVGAPTLEFLKRAAIERDRPSLVVLDPPRAGAGVDACRLLERIAAQTIVYVSCDPATLARDLAVLEARYRVERLTMFDLFPQTAHVETVATLERIR